jgi:hypothetical protein
MKRREILSDRMVMYYFEVRKLPKEVEYPFKHYHGRVTDSCGMS